MSAAIIVPTLNAGLTWGEWVSAILATGINVRDVYIIDSGSIDDTVLQASNAGFSVQRIESEKFDHGGTRQTAVDALTDYDFVIFLTQDAILSSTVSLQQLLLPFDDKQVGAVCGRQLPREKSGAIEAHARIYNYSSASFSRSINDVNKYGLKTAFISNSFAAYRVSALIEVEGFPDNVIFGEDMYVAVKMLNAGYKIAYAADACVYHSHSYSFLQEMRRYFDMGVFHAREPWIRKELGGVEGEGLKFVLSEYKYLLKHAFWRVPVGALRTLFRYMGFRLGLMEGIFPFWLKRLLAMNKGYFKN